MASHTGRKTFFESMRNKSDRVLKAIADTDGLIGVVSLPMLLGRKGDLNTLLDAVEDMVSVVGVDHTSIATDYSYLNRDPSGKLVHGSLGDADFKPGWWGNTLKGASGKKSAGEVSTEHFGGSLSWTNWPLFTVGLVKRGFKDDEIQKILGGNFLRVLKANTVS
jgi:membrane dipeptidase